MTLQCLVSSTAINTSHWNLISGRKRGCSVLLARLEIYARGIPSPSHRCLQTRFSVMCLSCHIVRLLADATKPFGLIWRQHCSSRKSICVINKYTECTRELGLCLETWSWQYFEYQFWISSQAISILNIKSGNLLGKPGLGWRWLWGGTTQVTTPEHLLAWPPLAEPAGRFIPGEGVGIKGWHLLFEGLG